MLPHNLNIPIILASQSPRRQQLLREIGLKFSILTQHSDENYDPQQSSVDIAQAIALQKATAVINTLSTKSLVIAADTIVCLNDTIFGKPTSKAHALQIIKQLAGKQHQVITGVALCYAGQQYTFAETTQVYMRNLSITEMQYYINTYKPFDKAGAYAIQEWIGMLGIQKIEGCYFNVMGLPIQRLWKELQQFLRVTMLTFPT